MQMRTPWSRAMSRRWKAGVWGNTGQEADAGVWGNVAKAGIKVRGYVVEKVSGVLGNVTEECMPE